MNIIKTGIVAPVYDQLWADVEVILTDAAPKPVLVMVNDADQGSAEEVLLQKMLQACKLSPEQYNIVRLKEEQLAAWHQLRDRLQPAIIILFGTLPAQLGISALFNLNHPNNFDNCTWLPTLSISELTKHEEMKKQLWLNGMKPVFADNSNLS